ncbi:hypothetical protein ACFVDQ_18025 [Streptomyces sp. NPDC057684]|uniref:hypothetical protein n=1 Tax=Streptomyces sp. NPDC057684 TaxID=3346211 RepID=UPI0036A8FB89
MGNAAAWVERSTPNQQAGHRAWHHAPEMHRRGQQPVTEDQLVLALGDKMALPLRAEAVAG